MNANGEKAHEALPAPQNNGEADVVVQDCASGIYFAGLGTWTASLEKALCFSREQDAQHFVQAHGLHNVRIIARGAGA